VRYAEEAGADTDKHDDSGIPEFLHMMQHLIERDSVQIKKQTPANNLAHFARQLIAASQCLGERHTRIDQALQQLNQDVESRYQGMVGEMIAELNLIVAQEMQDYRGDNKALTNNIAEKLRLSCSDKVERAQAEQLNKLEGDVAAALSFNSSDDLPGFAYEYASSSYSDSGKKSILGGTSGTAAGAALGGLFGGPLGALAGGFIGGALGNRAGNAMGTERTLRVIVGDNRYQIEEEAYTLFSEAIRQQLDQVYRTPVLDVTAQVSDALQAAESELQQFCHRHQHLV
jgi:hypothetical protein